MIDCEIFLSCWSRSQIISRIQKHMQPHKVLETQIRNVLRKWQRNQGSTVFLLTSQNAEIATSVLRTQISRAPCRRRTGEASILRAGKFGDLVTADHKVLNEECVNQGTVTDTLSWYKILPLPWIQSYPCKKNLRKFLEPVEKPKVICSDNSLEFAKSCED